MKPLLHAGKVFAHPFFCFRRVHSGPCTLSSLAFIGKNSQMIGQPFPLTLAVRFQASDQFHRYLHNPHIVQPDGVDSLPRTKGGQQEWLNTEQWDGYSDSYLERYMQYAGTPEHPNPQISHRHDLLYRCLGLVYELYGTLADDLQQLHDDPFHPKFHLRIANIKREREKIAEALDHCYKNLHPTVKAVYDAYLVRRYYHLADWITHVERKRAHILEQLSPEFIQQAVEMRNLSQRLIKRLKLMGSSIDVNPTLGLLSNNELDQYTTEELAILQQKASYFRKMRRFGVNQLDSDVHTH
ncbi:unnamed protein product [Phytomonas sp. EM1]|nr:unnamed protein product [Phytomonas sp. EM1]|eukprot:CCW64561.1 unnamed protein product [Phytomonas sp. isolate EM1]